MARINTYQVDGSISANDIVIGSEYNGVNSTGIPIYKTKNYRMSDLQTFLAGGDFQFDSPITIQTTSDGSKKWIHDNITVSTPSAVTSTLTHSGQFTVVTGITTDSYTEGGSTVTKGHVKQINTATYTLPDYKFNIAADSNPGSDDAVIDINSSSFDTLNVLGGSVLTSKITADDTITIDHNEYTAKSITTDAVDVLHTFVSDVYGHVTTITKRTLPTFGGADTSANTAGSKGVVPAPAVNDELKFLRGDSTWATVVQTSIITTDGTFIDLTPNSATSGSVTVTADLSATGTTSNATFLRGDNQWATPPGTYSFDINADATVSNDPVFNKEITSGQTLNILGGTNLGSTVSANDTVTINHDTFTTASSDYNPNAVSPDFGGSVRVLRDLAVSNGHVTDKQSYLVNMPSLPLASSSAIGCIKIGYVESGKNYPLELSSEKAYVNVPWVNTQNTTTLSFVDSTNDIILRNTTGGAGSGDQDIKFVAGSNIALTHTDVNNITISSTNTTYQAGTGITESSNTFSLTVGSSSADQYNDMLFNISGVATTGALSWNPAVFKLKVHSDSTGPYVQGSSTNITLNASSNVILQTGGVNRITTNSTSTTITGNISITGTISTGTWNGTVISSAYLDSDTAHLTETQTFSGAKSFSSAVNITSNTNATSKSTGALIVAGGVGVDDKLHVGDTITSDTRVLVGSTNSTSGRTFASEYSGNTFIDIRNIATGGGTVLIGNVGGGPGYNAIYSREEGNGVVNAREFRIIQSKNSANVNSFIIDSSHVATFVDKVVATNFQVSSDIRLKSEIKPIKEGLEVIKKFTSYNYIKGGEKESGFIAQEVKEAIPHTVYENNEGYLSMSDRGVLAHMHKAILELEERLTAIENKIK